MTAKKAQMTIFVIIAIVLAVGIVVYFVVKGNIGISNVSPELKPVFDYYKACISEDASEAVKLAGSQGGYIEAPEYKPGSEYAPFSSELNFLGFPVPYWYYISGNGLIKEQLPSKSDIIINIEEYISNRLNECDFSPYFAQGFNIERKESDVNVILDKEKMTINVKSDLIVSKDELTGRVNEHIVEIDTKLGKFYDIAKNIYEKQRNDAVFETYAVDVLRLYAPVDGVEISCSGKIWKTGDVISNLKSGLEANIGAIKFKGNYYTLNDKKDEYYVIDTGKKIDENINLIYSKSMPAKVEINGEGVDNDLMIASPVGIQEGLGILGFCYAPYHFVYDASFPVIVQIYNNEEIFQFPVVVIIDNNVAREAAFSEIEQESEEFDLCEFKTQSLEVNIYDVNLNKINANISYQCFNQRCKLGESTNGRFVGNVPSCLNGKLLLKAEGFTDKSEEFSTNKERTIDVILDKKYNVKLDLKVGGKNLAGTAMISFTKKDGKSTSTLLPDVSEIELSEGEYTVKIYVYGNSSITIPASKKTQCQEIPRSGILGFFGGTKEECFDIEIPETKIEYALRGGGEGDVYLLNDQLEKGKLEIEVEELPSPKSLEELQYNYASFEGMRVNIT